MFSRLIAPVTIVLNKMTFTTKFALLFILYLIPVVYGAYFSIAEDTDKINETMLEKNGLAYMQTLRPLFEHIAQARGMTHTYHNGKTSLRQKIGRKHDEINQELETLARLDQQFGHLLKTGQRLEAIRKQWSHVVNNAYTMTADEAFTAHTAIIEEILKLKVIIQETAHLMLDPSLDSNFMASAISSHIPRLTETLGKTRGLGAGVAAKGSYDKETLLKLTGLIKTIENANTTMMHDFDTIAENNPAVGRQLATMRQNALNATREFIRVTQTRILKASKINLDPDTYFALGTSAISNNLKLYDATLPALDRLLDNRISTLKQEIRMNLASSILLLVVTIILFSGFFNSLMGSINKIKNAVHEMAAGNLTTRIRLDTRDEMQLIANDMNMMIEKTNTLISHVVDSVNQVVTASAQGVAASDNTRDGVNQQDIEIEQVAAAMNEMSATVHEVANNAASTAEATRHADTEANKGQSVVNQTIQSINQLSDEMDQASVVIKQLESDSESIGTVLDVIRGIAEQTNLLALNAAIEAARAGEQGRGFAVVADEVRTLAGRTQESTREIQNMIEKLQQGAQNAVTVMDNGTERIKQTVEHAGNAGVTLDAITRAVEHITQMNEQIASAAEEQSSVAEEINRNIVSVRDIARSTVENANQTAVSSASLQEVASTLKVHISEFRVN